MWNNEYHLGLSPSLLLDGHIFHQQFYSCHSGVLSDHFQTKVSPEMLMFWKVFFSKFHQNFYVEGTILVVGGQS